MGGKLWKSYRLVFLFGGRNDALSGSRSDSRVDFMGDFGRYCVWGKACEKHKA